MSHSHCPPPSRCSTLQSWTIAIVLATSSLACGDDDPVEPLRTPITLEIVAGDGQVGGVAEVLPEPLIVRVLDQAGNPVAGVTVAWTAQGGGSVDPDTVVTDSQGIAAVSRLLGPTAGDQTTTAAVSLPGIPPATFTTTAIEGD